MQASRKAKMMKGDTSMFVDFVRLTTSQQSQARRLRPKWASDAFPRFAFWIRPNGMVSRRFGHHQLTKAEGEKLDAMLRDDWRPPSKMATEGWKPGTKFHVGK